MPFLPLLVWHRLCTHPSFGMTMTYAFRDNLVLATLSEEVAHPTVYNHPSQVSVDNQLSGLAKCREDSGVQMPLSQVVFCSLALIYLSPLS